jgi:serine/threonine protein kinase
MNFVNNCKKIILNFSNNNDNDNNENENNFNKNLILQNKNNSKIYIKDFCIDKILQNGYSGFVFSGKEINTNKNVAIKCCHKEHSFEKEIFSLKNLNHKNIIKLVGKNYMNLVIEKEIMGKYLKTVHVFAQELAKYGDLYNLLLKNGAFSEKITRTISKQILEGLVYAYSKGFSHRDIKLENIFLMDDGRIVIGDWGLSVHNSDKRLCKSSCGTLGYMPPEMIRQEYYNGNKADVWSLGVLIFSVAVNLRPYNEPEKRTNNEIEWDNLLKKDDWLNTMLTKNWKIYWLSHDKNSSFSRSLSDNFKKMFIHIFEHNYESRISLSDLLENEWFKSEVCDNNQILKLF